MTRIHPQRDEIDSLLRQVDLADLIEQRSPTRFGTAVGHGEKRTVKGPCPWCGGTDRFAVFIEDEPQHYYCGIHGNGCGAMGDAIAFLRTYEHKSFGDALADLAGDSSLRVRYQSGGRTEAAAQSWESKDFQERVHRFSSEAQTRLWQSEGSEVLAYVRSRRLTDKTIQAAHLGAVLHEGIGYLALPWWSRYEGKYRRVTLRDIRPGIDRKRRYRVLTGSSNEGLYLADSLILTHRVALFLVEGELDALSIAQEVGDQVGVCATGSLTGGLHPIWAMRLSILPHVFVAFDREEKSEEKAGYWLRVLANARRWYPIGHDANAMLTSGLPLRPWVEAAFSTLAETPPTSEPEPELPTPPLHCRRCGNVERERWRINRLRWRWVCMNCGELTLYPRPMKV